MPRCKCSRIPLSWKPMGVAKPVNLRRWSAHGILGCVWLKLATYLRSICGPNGMSVKVTDSLVVLEQSSQWHELHCHDLEVMSSNPGQVELGYYFCPKSNKKIFWNYKTLFFCALELDLSIHHYFYMAWWHCKRLLTQFIWLFSKEKHVDG